MFIDKTNKKKNPKNNNKTHSSHTHTHNLSHFYIYSFFLLFPSFKILIWRNFSALSDRKNKRLDARARTYMCMSVSVCLYTVFW